MYIYNYHSKLLHLNILLETRIIPSFQPPVAHASCGRLRKPGETTNRKAHEVNRVLELVILYLNVFYVRFILKIKISKL